MLPNSSFKERFARLAEAPAADPALSVTAAGNSASYLLRATGNMPQRVTLAQLLIEHGLGPRQAHRVVTQLAETLLDPAGSRSPVPVHLPTVPDAAAVQRRLAELQVEAAPFLPAEVDARAVRAATGLTQEEFARRFGLDLVTRRGVPVVRILPVEGGNEALTAGQKAILDRLLGEKLSLAPWPFDRDELYDR